MHTYRNTDMLKDFQTGLKVIKTAIFAYFFIIIIFFMMFFFLYVYNKAVNMKIYYQSWDYLHFLYQYLY